MRRLSSNLPPLTSPAIFSGVPDVPPGCEHADLFIRCDKRSTPSHLALTNTVQCLRSNAILGWNQAFSERAAIQAARREMRERGREESGKKSRKIGA